MQSRVVAAAAAAAVPGGGGPYALQPAEYLIQKFKASSSPQILVSPSTTPPKYSDVTLADGGGGGLLASPRGSVDCLSDTASLSSADGYINDCIKAAETICLARAELPEGSRQWHAVMEELSPRHSLENLCSAFPAAAGAGASQRRGSDKSPSGLLGAAVAGGDSGQHQRARANTMPSSVNAQAQATKKESPRMQRVRFA